MTEKEKFEEILLRRENEVSPPWPRAKWDYSEWEEALDELNAWKARTVLDELNQQN